MVRPAASEGYAKSLVTRARILDAARLEAGERGFHKASVARIAARADTAIGSVHYHFGSRTQLLRELMRTLMADLTARLAAARSDPASDFFTRLRAEQLAYVDYIRANPHHVRLADEIKFHEPDLYREGMDDWVTLLAAEIRAGVAERSLRPMDDTEILAQAHFLLGARHYLESMLGGDDGVEGAAVVDAYIGLVRDGLGRRRDPERRA
jgi:AcrR family transcriptional regulator